VSAHAAVSNHPEKRAGSGTFGLLERFADTAIAHEQLDEQLVEQVPLTAEVTRQHLLDGNVRGDVLQRLRGRPEVTDRVVGVSFAAVRLGDQSPEDRVKVAAVE